MILRAYYMGNLLKQKLEWITQDLLRSQHSLKLSNGG